MLPQQFINTIARSAKEDMCESRVPASLTIAQAILESSWGESGLTKRANNLFGIKGTGPAGSVTMPTSEYVGGQWVTVDAAFRAYHSWDESIADHSKLILNGTVDKPARYHMVLGADYYTACYAIWHGGYATDPGYPEKLIGLIESYRLWEYDEKVKEEEMVLEELKQQVDQLVKMNEQLKQKVTELERLHNMPVPDWAQEAVSVAVNARGIDGKPLINTPDGGSYDFYRVLTIMDRQGLLNSQALGNIDGYCR